MCIQLVRSQRGDVLVFCHSVVECGHRLIIVLYIDVYSTSMGVVVNDTGKRIPFMVQVSFS